MNPKKRVVNYTTPFNFEKFHKAEFHLELDETTTIEFTMQPILV